MKATEPTLVSVWFPSVWVLGIPYAIERWEEAAPWADGYVEFATQKIKVFKGERDTEFAKELVFHEIVHTVDHGLGPHLDGIYEIKLYDVLDAVPRAAGVASKLRVPEQVVCQWSKCLFATLRDPRNVALKRWLFDDPAGVVE